MSGYAAAGRISGASPRFVARATRSVPGRADLSASILAPMPVQPAVVVILSFDATEAARPPGRALAERWDAFRERWSQLTFYLSSGDSWR